MATDLFFPDKNESGSLTLNIMELGAQGEGIAFDSQGQKIYVPKSLPGESISGKPSLRRGSQRMCRVETIIQPSPDRIAAFCPVYDRCGGCTLQHMSPTSYAQFKRQNAVNLLSRYIAPESIQWGFMGTLGQRRRVSLSYRHEVNGLKLGFFVQNSHYLVAIESCPLLTPALNALIEPLRDFLETIIAPREEGFIHLTDTVTGVDCSWSPHRCKKKGIDPDLWSLWAQFAQRHNLAHLTRAGKELIVSMRTPIIDIAGKHIRFPSAAFLQPSQQSQEMMQSTLLNLLRSQGYLKDGTPMKVLDLFCGLGTFSIPFLEYGFVMSLDVAGPSLASLKEHQSAQWSIGERDLMSHPMTHAEIQDFDCIILDPPRAGAQTQVQIIAEYFKKPVVMISCDLATAARDAQAMIEGGYTLTHCLLFDQFPYTAHLETMCMFEHQS